MQELLLQPINGTAARELPWQDRGQIKVCRLRCPLTLPPMGEWDSSMSPTPRFEARKRGHKHAKLCMCFQHDPLYIYSVHIHMLPTCIHNGEEKG